MLNISHFVCMWQEEGGMLTGWCSFDIPVDIEEAPEAEDDHDDEIVTVHEPHQIYENAWKCSNFELKTII